MNKRHVIFFILFTLIAPVLVSTYLAAEKKLKLAYSSFLAEEEEHESGEKSPEKDSEKWEKEKYQIANTCIAFHSQSQVKTSYFYLLGELLSPFTSLTTPPPKNS